MADSNTWFFFLTIGTVLRSVTFSSYRPVVCLVFVFTLDSFKEGFANTGWPIAQFKVDHLPSSIEVCTKCRSYLFLSQCFRTELSGEGNFLRPLFAVIWNKHERFALPLTIHFNKPLSVMSILYNFVFWSAKYRYWWSFCLLLYSFVSSANKNRPIFNSNLLWNVENVEI